MNQQQLNKIDEEFDEKFKEVITTANYHLDTGVSCISLEDIKDFIHSKLQEAIKGERERITEIALKVSSKIEDKGWLGADYCDGVHSACSNFIKEIKSLQTKTYIVYDELGEPKLCRIRQLPLSLISKTIIKKIYDNKNTNRKGITC